MVKKSVRQILKGNRRVVVSEGIAFFIQIGIFFMVLRMFNTGLKGADIPLLYDFMPAVSLPFNLVFLDTFDLTKPSFSLNLIQTLTILLVEIASLIDSPFPLTRTDIVRYIIILPVASFIIFAFLPAGKKLFVITTLMFSFFYLLSNILTRTFSNLLDKMDKKTIKAAIPGSENPEQVG